MGGFDGLIRIVDPVGKRVVSFEEENDNETHQCFQFWKTGKQCDNCISMRAFQNDDTFIKFEYDQEKIYFITASPIVVNETKYVVELVKDITETGMMTEFNGQTVEQINQRLEMLNAEVVTDELTKAFNRRYINERLPVDIEHAKRENKELSLILLDLDHYKIINDTYGHLAGDSILKTICATIKTMVKEKNAWFGRFGGDEILISLYDTNQSEVNMFASNICKAVEQASVTIDENAINVTTSAGVYFMPKGGCSMEDLINGADKNLYRAKQKGGNCVVM